MLLLISDDVVGWAEDDGVEYGLGVSVGTLLLTSEDVVGKPADDDEGGWLYEGMIRLGGIDPIVTVLVQLFVTVCKTMFVVVTLTGGVEPGP